ncbi:MAG: hypothetical protein OK454_09250 [Thaumarchaeota archaeon]|nr:hypothetical protein [Nitrososphaerota archaeon]
MWYSVVLFQSSTSMSGRPEISSSSSCSLKMEISAAGMISWNPTVEKRDPD